MGIPRVGIYAGCVWLALVGCSVSTNQFAGLQACQVDTDCPLGSICHPDGICLLQSCETPADCGASTIAWACIDGTCAGVGCNEFVRCDSGYVCESGFCVVCFASGEEGPAGAESCIDGVDNDCNGSGDALDPSCMIACLSEADCSNDNPCDGDESCDSGACVAGTAIDCSTLDDPTSCIVGECNSTTGLCERELAADGAPCSDEAFCLVGESCALGACQPGILNSCAEVIDACNPTVICDEMVDTCVPIPLVCPTDSNPCTTDCDPDVGCNAPLPDGTACQAGAFCTAGDGCVAGACTEGALSGCDDGDACTVDACSEESDLCTHVRSLDLLTEGLSLAGTCDDGVDNDCDGNVDLADVECNSCALTMDCTDNNLCTDNVCEDGICTNPGRPDGYACDDGNACTSDDACTSGGCGGVLVTCGDDDNFCTFNLCDVVSGCYPPIADGTSCDDGMFCNTADSCTAGVCGGISTCDDGIACTIDSCEGDCIAIDDDAACGLGEICEPLCFAGMGGCGTPPQVGMTCENDAPTGLASPCTVTAESLEGQLPCLGCETKSGVDVLAFADFSVEGACDLDGWTAEGDWTCPLSTSILAGEPALEVSFGDFAAVERTFSTIGYDHLRLCWDFADSAAGANAVLRVSYDGSEPGCDSTEVITEAAGPVAGMNGIFFDRCLSLDTLDAACTMQQTSLLIRFEMDAVAAPAGHIYLDNIGLYAWPDECTASTFVVDDTVPCSIGCSPISNGWTIESGVVSCDCTTGYYMATSDTLMDADVWMMYRTVDLSDVPGEAFLAFDIDEVGADETGELVRVQARLDDADPWLTVFHYTGDLSPLDAFVTFVVNLSQVLGDGANGSSTVGVRIRVGAQGSGAGNVQMRIDHIRVGGLELLCETDDNVILGETVESGGGTYSTTVTSLLPQLVQLQCGWKPAASLPAFDSIEFRP